MQVDWEKSWPVRPLRAAKRLALVASGRLLGACQPVAARCDTATAAAASRALRLPHGGAPNRAHSAS
jgi:hypothetical protein